MAELLFDPGDQPRCLLQVISVSQPVEASKGLNHLNGTPSRRLKIDNTPSRIASTIR
jgi:hypothetical protein